MTLAVGQAPVLQDLQEGVPNLWVGLLNLVEEDGLIGPSAHGFGQLTAFLVTYVARWGAGQAGGRVSLLVLTHVHSQEGFLVVEEEPGQGLGQFRLAHPRWPQEDEGADGSLGILETGAGAADSIGDGHHRFILADDALV